LALLAAQSGVIPDLGAAELDAYDAAEFAWPTAPARAEHEGGKLTGRTVSQGGGDHALKLATAERTCRD
jgi:hypothetical protein